MSKHAALASLETRILENRAKVVYIISGYPEPVPVGRRAAEVTA